MSKLSLLKRMPPDILKRLISLNILVPVQDSVTGLVLLKVADEWLE